MALSYGRGSLCAGDFDSQVSRMAIGYFEENFGILMYNLHCLEGPRETGVRTRRLKSNIIMRFCEL